MIKLICPPLILFFVVFIFHSQEKTIKGIVLDKQTNKPLEGASVYIPKTNLGTVTNQNGLFIFEIPQTATSIKIGFLGYKTKTLKTTEHPNDTIYLEPYQEVLESVVVTSKPVPEILKDVIKSTKKKLKESMVLKTYNREVLKTDNNFSYYADAIAKYHLRGDRKKVKADMYLLQSRVFEQAGYDVGNLMDKNPFGYDITEMIRDGFSDFAFLKSVFRSENKYEFELKTKKFGDSLTVNIINFKPKKEILEGNANNSHTSTFDYFLFKGEIVYDPSTKLLLNVRIEKNSNKEEHAIEIKSFIFEVTLFDYGLEIDYRLTKDQYILTRYKKHQKHYIGKVLLQKYFKTFDFHQVMITLDYKVGHFDFKRRNRYKEKSLLMSEKGHTEPFWEQNGIVPTPLLNNFIHSKNLEP